MQLHRVGGSALNFARILNDDDTLIRRGFRYLVNQAVYQRGLATSCTPNDQDVSVVCDSFLQNLSLCFRHDASSHLLSEREHRTGFLTQRKGWSTYDGRQLRREPRTVERKLSLEQRIVPPHDRIQHGCDRSNDRLCPSPLPFPKHTRLFAKTLLPQDTIRIQNNLDRLRIVQRC